jgi:hypothetical protein
MSSFAIWGTALFIYAAFWSWYVGFRKKITPAEVEETMRLFDREGSWSGQQLEHVRNFLANDDGKDFVMVNLLQLHTPVAESRQKLDAYQKIFLGSLLRKAGHPVLIARAASGNIENIACDQADNWGAAGLIRYRSRRDFMEILPATIGREHHGLKLAALEKTLAFPASPWFMLGGPRIVVALAIALVAALLQILGGA